MEDEDLWFYDSIKRFNKLQMFTLNEVAHNIEFSPNEGNICIDLARPGKFQILEYMLPAKYLDLTDTLCSTDHNLKMRSGTYLDHSVYQLKVLNKCNRILATEHSRSYISSYSLPQDVSVTDKITKESDFDCGLDEPQISNHSCNETTLTVCHSTSDPVSILDWNRKFILKNIYLNEESPSHVHSIFISPSVIAVLFLQLGQVKLFDLRNVSQIASYRTRDKLRFKSGSIEWSMSSLENSNIVNLLSTKAAVEMFDIRKLDKPIFHTQLYVKNTVEEGSRCRPIIQTSPSEPNMFSVSGFNENVSVYVWAEEDKCDEMFTHDAHAHMDGCDEDTIVLCHRWMPSPYQRMLISSANNGTINCIQFNV